MSRSRLKSVELSLVETGSELVPAVQAAQFARFVKAEDTRSEVEARAIEGFVVAFASGTEAWEDAAAPARARLLATLGRQLAVLERAGLFVHAGATTLALPDDGGELPVAILVIGRTAVPAITVMVPAEVEVEGPPTAH